MAFQSLQVQKQPAAQFRRALYKSLLLNYIEVRQSHRARRWVPRVSIGVHPLRLSRRRPNRLGNAITNPDTSQGNVATRYGLGKGHDIRGNCPMVKGKPSARATETGNHFVGYEQYFIAVANLAHAAEIVSGRHDNTTAPLHRFRVKCRDCVRSLTDNCPFE